MTANDSDHIAPRRSDPPRPDFAGGMRLQPEIPRPKAVIVSLVLVLLSALAFIPYIVVAAPRHRQIRDRLEQELAERSPDYPASDVEMAVLIGVIGLAVLSILFVLGEIRAVRNLARKRRGGRTWLLVITVLHLPIIAVSQVIHDGGRQDLISAAVQAVCLAVATLIAYLPRVTRWLTVVQRQGPIPLRTSAERQS